MRSTTKWLLVPVLLCCLSLATDCTKQEPEWKGRIVAKDGVTIVENPKEPIYGGSVISLDEDLTIKGSEKDEEQMFQSINTMDVDEDGTMYLLDEQAGNIKVYDSAGSFLNIIGRKGQGPGEFGLPISLSLTPEHNIVVNDMGQRKLLVFDRDGRYLEQISLVDKFLFLGPMIVKDGSMVVIYTIPSDKPETFLKKFSPRLEPLLSFASVFVERPPVADIFVALRLSRLIWNVTPDGMVIWADIKNPAYVLHEHNMEGKLIREMTRDFDPIPITADDRERLMDVAFGDNPTRDQWDVRFPETYPPFKGFSFDDEGRMFVRRYERDESDEGELYEIFDKERRYMARQRFKMNPLIWTKGYMYAIEEDTEGFKIVKRYKVKWNM